MDWRVDSHSATWRAVMLWADEVEERYTQELKGLKIEERRSDQHRGRLDLLKQLRELGSHD